jgi:hypothetical protein
MSFCISRLMVCLPGAIAGLFITCAALAAEPSQARKDSYSAAVKSKIKLMVPGLEKAEDSTVRLTAAAFSGGFVGSLGAFYVDGSNGNGVFVIDDPNGIGVFSDSFTYFLESPSYYAYHGAASGFDVAFPRIGAGSTGLILYRMQGTDPWYPYETCTRYEKK